MSIVIDTDLTLVMQRLNISEAKMRQQYASKSVEEIVEAEAAAGNQAAVAFAREIFTSPRMLVKIFKLADPENKIAFLKEMTSDQLKEFLPLMEEEDLNEGLRFFDMNKLMSMLEEIPPDQLVKTVFQLFTEKEVIQYLPEEQLDKFLENPDIDKTQIMNNLKLIPQEYLAQMYEAVSGENSEKTSSQDLLDKIGALNPMQFTDAIRVMQPAAKQQLTLGIAHAHQELYQNFDAHAYTNMMQTYKYQPDVVKAMHVIDPDEKIKMLEKLPNDFLSVVITQIDAKVFAEQIIKNHPKLLAQAIIQ
mgnify:CR=1 FL=1